MRRWSLLLVALAAVAGGCRGGKAEHAAGGAPRGGTLRIGVAVPGDPLATLDAARIEFSPAVTELLSCCLTRTLLNYRTGTTEEGGAVLRPDLAAALPQVADDGLTYTFRLKPGLRYAPPYERVSMKAQDVVRAIEHALRVGPPGPLVEIEGAQQFRGRKAGRVSGLETPDDRTLVVHVTKRIGDLGERFSDPTTAPIPPEADVGFGKVGAIPVATGPYMLAGSERLDYAHAAARRLPSGFAPGKRITLIRNPSWTDDGLRADYADRIVLSLERVPHPDPSSALAADKAAADVDEGRLDLAIGPLLPTDEQLRRYSSSPQLRKRLFTHVGNVVRFISLNVALPPFDDIHVRKAANLVVDKKALIQATSTGLGGRIADHIAPDALLDNLLLDYDPYPTPGHHGDLEAAKREMRKSRYDRNHDGVCDAVTCRSVLAPVRNDDPAIIRLGHVARDSLRRIGIDLDVKVVDPDTYFGKLITAQGRVPVVPALGILLDNLNAASFFPGLFYGPLLGTPAAENVSLVGASPQQLRRWGYRVRAVPSVDGKIRQCLRLIARSQTECWAETDQLLMERVVPWVPYLFEATAFVVSRRVARFTFSQSSAIELPAFDRIALKAGSD